MSHLHSIYLTDEAGDSDPLPWRIERNLESLRFYHPRFAHGLYRNESGRAFIEQHFDREVLEAYDELLPYSYRSDLLRYCLLYQLGGIYADVSIHFFASLEPDPAAPRLRLFRDMFNQAPWITSTSLVYAPARVELFENCVREVVRNVSTGYYGFNPLCPTGPNLLGMQIARWGKLEAMTLGEACPIRLGNGGPVTGLTYVSHDGALVAVNGKRGSGLATLGSETRNNYNDFYSRRKIYRRELDGPSVWTHQEYRDRSMMSARPLDKQAGRYLFARGFAIYGPYVSLDAGEHTVRFVFGDDDPTRLTGARIDIARAGKCIGPAVQVVPHPTDEGFALSISFRLDRPYDAVEVRLILEDEQELKFVRMELTSRAGGS